MPPVFHAGMLQTKSTPKCTERHLKNAYLSMQLAVLIDQVLDKNCNCLAYIL